MKRYVAAAPSQWKISDKPVHAPKELVDHPDVWMKLASKIGHDPDSPLVQQHPVIGGRRRYHHHPLSTWRLNAEQSLTITTSVKEAKAWALLKDHSNAAFPRVDMVVKLPVKPPLFAIVHEPLSYPVDADWALFIDTFFKWRAMEKRALAPATTQDMEDFLRFLIDPRLSDKKTVKKDRIEDVIPFDMAVDRREDISRRREVLLKGHDLEGKIAWAKSALSLLHSLGIEFEDLDPSNLGKTSDGRTVIVNIGESGESGGKLSELTAAAPMLPTAQALDHLLSDGKNPKLQDYLFLSTEMRYILHQVWACPEARMAVEWMAGMAPRPSDGELARAASFFDDGAVEHGERFAALAALLNAKLKRKG